MIFDALASARNPARRSMAPRPPPQRVLISIFLRRAREQRNNKKKERKEKKQIDTQLFDFSSIQTNEHNPMRAITFMVRFFLVFFSCFLDQPTTISPSEASTYQ